MPETRAASRFPPIAYAERPRVVRERMNQPTRAQAPATTAISGTPKTESAPSVVTVSGTVRPSFAFV
jgi:hypothetical protein